MSHPRGVIINNIISDLKKQGALKIYADILGFDAPFEITAQESEKAYQPDVIGVNKNSTDIFSIETNISTRVGKSDLDKWKCYVSYLKENDGNLFLVGDNYCIDVIKKCIDPIPANLKFIHLV